MSATIRTVRFLTFLFGSVNCVEHGNRDSDNENAFLSDGKLYQIMDAAIRIVKLLTCLPRVCLKDRVVPDHGGRDLDNEMAYLSVWKSELYQIMTAAIRIVRMLTCLFGILSCTRS
jgi:hypothetical protein